jgi:hypothetical protein
MPNTLAALPSSQYATLFDVVLGKELDLPSVFVAASASTAPPAFGASMVALLRRGWVDFHLTDCRTDGRDEHREAETTDRIGVLRHGLHTNKRRESRGAAVRSCGNAWNIEAITATLEGEEGAMRLNMSSTLAFRWFDGPAFCQGYPAYRAMTGGSDDPPTQTSSPGIWAKIDVCQR